MFRSMFDFVNTYLPCSGITARAIQDQSLPRQASTDTQRSVAQALQTVATIFGPTRGVGATDEAQLRKNENNRNIVYLVLLGAAQSGKSTFYKQLQLLHANCFTTEKEKLIYLPIIHENLLSAMDTLVTRMPMYQIALTSPGSEKNLEEFRAFMEHYRRSHQYFQVLRRQELEDAIQNPKTLKSMDDKLPMTLGLCIDQLWQDPGVQQIYGLSHQFQLNETAKYFLENAKRICSNEYIPTIQDILHARLKTVGSSELRFDVKNYEFRVIDVGGQRCQRTKWLSYFNEVHGVIYIASLGGYNLMLEEDPTMNRMIESIKLFYLLASSAYFAWTPFILFLNKIDLFREKLEKYPLRMCFEQYNGPNRYEPAISYVEDRFRAHFQRSRSTAKKAREFQDAPYLYKNKPKMSMSVAEPIGSGSGGAADDDDAKINVIAERLYVHHTCATDTEQMQFVFNAAADIIMESTLNQIGLS